MIEHSIRITFVLLDYLGHNTQECAFSDMSEKSIDLIIKRIEKDWSIVFVTNLSQGLPKYMALRSEGIYLERLSKGKIVKFGEESQHTPYDTNVIQLFSRILYLYKEIGRLVEYKHSTSVPRVDREGRESIHGDRSEEVVTGYAGIVSGDKYWRDLLEFDYHYLVQHSSNVLADTMYAKSYKYFEALGLCLAWMTWLLLLRLVL